MSYLTRTASAVAIGALCSQASAQEFIWEGEVEVGVESVLSSDAPGNELTDVYGKVSLGAELEIGQGVSLFGTLTGESVLDAEDDRAFEDIGFFLEELGVSLALGDNASVSLGKTAPTFGRTWDDGAGFFNDILAGDYEQTEQIGAFVEAEVTPGGTLSFGVFYADDTALSRSIGTDRGRNRASDGGAGNTGKLDNFALAWTQETGNTSFQVALRHLSASAGDVDDETGVVASVGHDFGNDFAVFAEVGSFRNFGGSADDATFVTLTGAYSMEKWTFAGLLAHRDLDAGGKTDAVSLSAEYAFDNDMVFGAGLAFVDDNGTKDTVFGANLVIPFGG